MRIQQHFKKTLINTKGQVAIFVALVFQVLFLFFAMVINVGLLVHHKINLQNSVDMAAYYGAMKMAENMNAMAHVNYQIRQSWKLLAFRYRILGTSGESQLKENSGRQTHPFKKDP
ncbi:MAG: TadE/TadG family type IV pilus assembly protein, partial [Bdellovibrionia bacterium]